VQLLCIIVGLPKHHRSAEMADIVLVFQLKIDTWHHRVRVRVRVRISDDLWFYGDLRCLGRLYSKAYRKLASHLKSVNILLQLTWLHTFYFLADL